MGRTGEDVKILQRFLGLTGTAVSGTFDNQTRALVIAWQEDNDLKGLSEMERLDS